jgi:hypothetical protein
MIIKFHEPTFVLEQKGGGFMGLYETKAIQIKPVPFEVISVETPPKTLTGRKPDYCNILVWSDGCIDGDRQYLINVPKVFFEVIEDKYV